MIKRPLVFTEPDESIAPRHEWRPMSEWPGNKGSDIIGWFLEYEGPDGMLTAAEQMAAFWAYRVRLEKSLAKATESIKPDLSDAAFKAGFYKKMGWSRTDEIASLDA
jgi:hypothetical protein